MAKDDKKIQKTSASEIETLRRSDGSPLLFQAVQKINQQPVDLGGAFLLNPMPRARQQHFLLEAGHGLFQGVKGLPIHRSQGIKLSTHEERWLQNLRAAQEAHQLPRPVDVPVPVEPTTKTGPLELACG